jgi:hypothetical protein
MRLSVFFARDGRITSMRTASPSHLDCRYAYALGGERRFTLNSTRSEGIGGLPALRSSRRSDRWGQPELLQGGDPPPAEVGGEQIGPLDLEPGLQSQLALPRVAIRLEQLIVNGFAQVGELRIRRPALLGQLCDLLA